MKRSEMKVAAKEQIRGKIGTLFLATLVASIVISIACYIPIVGQIATAAISFGMVIMYLRVARNQEISVGDVFKGFNHFWLSFKITFFMTLFICLWSCLLIIPGIVKVYSYSQAFNIAADNPEIGALEAITRSRKMMKGHKWEYFVMELSFIGWNLLAICTCGLLYIWLAPYMSTAFMNFYLAIGGDKSSAMYCPVCNGEVEADAVACSHCGVSFRQQEETYEQIEAPEAKSCPQCGQVCEDDDMFCLKCGTPL